MHASVSRKLRQHAEAVELENGEPSRDLSLLKHDAKRRARRAGSARARARARARDNLVVVQTPFPKGKGKRYSLFCRVCQKVSTCKLRRFDGLCFVS